MSGFAKCRLCGEVKVRSLDVDTSGKSVKFRDELGRMWNGFACPCCFVADCRLRLRSRKGRGDRRSVNDPKWVKGVESEDICAEWFRSIGYSVEQCDHNGPDLILSRSDLSISVEVKSVCYLRNGGRIVSRVYPRRQGDDWIAYVFKTGSVVIRSMAEHMAESSGKTHSVTKWDINYIPKKRSVYAG